jgi:hypothetical protein
MHALGERGAGQLDDALVALGMLTLIDGEGEIAGAQQARHRERTAFSGGADRGETLGVELGVAAHIAAAGNVGHHQPDRPIALGLQGEDAVIFERAGQCRRQRQHLRQQGRHVLGVAMPVEHALHQRS